MQQLLTDFKIYSLLQPTVHSAVDLQQEAQLLPGDSATRKHAKDS